MDKILEQALLYDFYGELLTAHQKEIYEQFSIRRSFAWGVSRQMRVSAVRASTIL